MKRLRNSIPKLVENVWHDVAWLQTYLNPKAKMQWRVTNPPESMEALNAWEDFHITQLTFFVNDAFPPYWKGLLPSLRHLTSLKICHNSNDSGNLFEIVAKSSQIVEFQVISPNYEFTTLDLVHLTQWFRDQPVRMFSCLAILSIDIEMDLKKAFFQAMFSCPTLDKLELSFFDLVDVDFTLMTFTMRSLLLGSCLLYSSHVEALARQLVGSQLTEFDLTGYNDDNLYGIECLVRCVPRTSIQYLALNFESIHDSPKWCNLAQLFENCTLDKLTIAAETIPPEFAATLGRAIQNNHTICELNLAWSDIAMDDLGGLIQSMTHPSRQVPTKRIKWESSTQGGLDPSVVQALMEFTASCGGEFVV
ncbi:hypothetical protein Ae201684P_006835 [Aphanomyces euteiches]|uniref:F-box domain-containing protein n=1 Tax=Aphanomyces euteiches TaxID=100861 RepID=A0A6G0WV85_9STRA|nr:hypothetical protein Ae201684_011292 [Aphanomyces euteiches]KAH9100640.1 hypothetical protein Ae201684P_006835 [Aphanomyces euteiches]KAH9144136.1 hypothetical protein AeRB84_011909 [Aphanomyces euteiches]